MSRRFKKAVRKISASKARQNEEDCEEIPISQLGARMKRGPSFNFSPIRPDFSPQIGNAYLFKDDNAHCNFTAFNKRPQAKCFYYDKNGIIQGNWENEKANEYVERWGWKPLLECNEPYLEIVVRAFYANIAKFPKDRVPWGFKTYVCGKELKVTVPNVAEWLGLRDEGEEVYLNKSWLKGRNAPTPESYLEWFGGLDNVTAKDKRFHITVLPSLHRLGHALLNHILTPKGGKKTTLEYNQMFYLRHLIDGSDRMFNLPFVIISHMLAAYSDRQRVLPYGNLIARMLKANGVDLSSSPNLIWPTNLWDHLDSYGWDLVKVSNTGARTYKAKDTSVNRWIAAPNALPNQYWDPSAGPSQAQGGGSSSQAAYSDNFQISVLEAFSNLNTKCDQIIQTQAQHSNEIELLKANYNGFNEWARGSYRNLYQDYQALKTRFVVRFGPDDDDLNNTPSASRDDGGDDGGDGSSVDGSDGDPMEP